MACKKLKLVLLEAEKTSGRLKKAVYGGIKRLEEISDYTVDVRDERLETESLETESLETAPLETEIFETYEDFEKATDEGSFRNCKFLICTEIDDSGINISCCRLMKYLCQNNDCLDGSSGGVIIDGSGELFTKELGRRLVFLANAAGATFPGKPLVEATGSLTNYDTLARNWGLDRMGAYIKSCSLLAEKVVDFEFVKDSSQAVLTIHASNRKTSNSLKLWEETAAHLRKAAIDSIEEVSIRNGEVWDCRGCKYEACLHFGEKASCFYGGVMVEKVYPAIVRSDVLVLVCPNYNDSVSANIMAFINRLTALFRTNDFSRKRVYAIIVSGYSGGDIVAQQIIGAINMNKNFILPPRFALIETANGPGDAMRLDGIDKRIEEFAKRIL